MHWTLEDDPLPMVLKICIVLIMLIMYNKEREKGSPGLIWYTFIYIFFSTKYSVSNIRHNLIKSLCDTLTAISLVMNR